MRIPILFHGNGAGEADAWLVEDGAAIAPGAYTVRFARPAQTFGHVTGCACCIARGPAAEALARMFRDRATGAAPFFDRVIVRASATGMATVRDALAGDAITQARYFAAD